MNCVLLQRLTWWSPANELLTVNLDRQTADDRFSVQQKYQRDRNLRIRSVLTDDAGVYECKLSQDHILASVRLIVNGTYVVHLYFQQSFISPEIVRKWHENVWVNRPLGQPTRPTQPFILSGPTDE